MFTVEMGMLTVEEKLIQEDMLRRRLISHSRRLHETTESTSKNDGSIVLSAGKNK